MVTLFIVLAVALSGGVSLVAESAVPGDALYGVKTHVNENIRSVVTTSAQADAQWEADLAERRLKEIETLSLRGELTSEVVETLGAQFSSHAHAALVGASTLVSEGQATVAADIAAYVEGMMQANASSVTKIEATSDSNVEAETSSIIDQIRLKLGRSANTTVESDAQVNSNIVNVSGKSTTSVDVGL